MSLWKKYREERKLSNESSNTKEKNNSSSSVMTRQDCTPFLEEMNQLNFMNFTLRCAIVSDVLYYENAFSENSERILLDLIYNEGERSNAWKQLKTRRLQCWGGLPTTTAGSETDNNEKNNNDGADRNSDSVMPSWLRDICNVFVQNGFFPTEFPPNHVLVNEYQPGEGIMHHTDGPKYYDRVVILSLGSSTIMSFCPRLSSEEIGNTSLDEQRESMSIFLHSKSLLYFTGDAYHNYLHGIEPRFFDEISLEKNLVNSPFSSEGCVNYREKRVSFTIRHMYK